MPRKTLALISGLVIVTVVLFVIALNSGKKPTTPPASQDQQPVTQVTPETPAHSVLTLSPNPVTVAAGKTGTVDVNIDPSDNQVTAVQLELAYDPNVISNVKVTPGPLFQNAVVLIDKNNVKEGRMTYAFGIQPNRDTVTTVGSVATITFTAKNVPGQKSQLGLLPTSIVTSRGVKDSVLKSATGTLIEVTSTTGY